jgi:hypothetical protein
MAVYVFAGSICFALLVISNTVFLWYKHSISPTIALIGGLLYVALAFGAIGAVLGALFAKIEDYIPGPHLLVKGPIFFLVCDGVAAISRGNVPSAESFAIIAIRSILLGALFGWLVLRLADGTRRNN